MKGEIDQVRYTKELELELSIAVAAGSAKENSRTKFLISADNGEGYLADYIDWSYRNVTCLLLYDLMIYIRAQLWSSPKFPP